jgi:hypothetical protein
MTFASVISLLLAIAKAIPIFDGWLKQLALAYTQWKLAHDDRVLREALQIMFADHDQRKLEEAIGSENAGKPAQDQSGVQTRPVRPRP